MQYIEETIDIRFESISIELEKSIEVVLTELSNLENKLIKKMDALEKEIIKKTSKVKKTCCSSYFKDLAKLKKKIDNLLLPKSLNSYFVKFEEIPYPLKFGKLVNEISFRKLTCSMINQFFNETPKIVSLNELNLFNASGMCSFDNLHLTIVNRDNDLFKLNSNFEMSNKCKINHAFIPRKICSISSDHNGNIYLNDLENSQILLKNMEKPKLLKCIGSMGYSTNEFYNPCALFYYKDFLYVLDEGNNRIKVYSSNCVLQKMILLVCSNSKQVHFIKQAKNLSVTEDVIAVSDHTKRIFIYNFDGLLKFLLDVDVLRYGVYSFLCIDRYLFVHGFNSSLTCFDLDTLCTNNVDIKPVFERFAQCLNNRSIAISYFNEQLVLLFENYNYLVVF